MILKILKMKLEVKKRLAEKYERQAASIPGKPRKGHNPGGNTRKRRAISKANQYAKQAYDLEIEIKRVEEDQWPNTAALSGGSLEDW